MEYRELVDFGLYRAGMITRPTRSQLGEREPTPEERKSIQALFEAYTVDDAYPVFGVDVSNWQGKIDWGLLSSKIYFAIIRSSYGSAGIDAAYEINLAQAHKYGRAVGLYHYLKPDRDFRKTAQLYYSLWKDSGSQILPSYDLEETGGLSKGALNMWMEKFLKAFYELAGRDGIFGQGYSSPGFMDANVMTTPTFDWPKKLEWWVAAWTTAAEPRLPACFSLFATPKNWTYWQYTSKLNGASYGVQSKSLDGNRFNGSLAQFNSKYSMNLKPLGEPVPPPVEPPPVEPPPTPEPSGVCQMKVVSAKGLNIRSGPGTTYPDIGDLAPGAIVTVKNIAGENAWVEIEPGKFACVQLGTTRYLEPVE